METVLPSFLSTAGCPQYLSNFMRFNMTSTDTLKHLDREILIEIGILAIGDRLRILRASRSLRKNDTTPQLAEAIEKINSLDFTLNDELMLTDKQSVIFILNDGSAIKISVNGCFNADSIKKRLIKRLPTESPGNGSFVSNINGDQKRSIEEFDVFVVNYAKNVLHLLYDVELVTICHSADRLEKARLILVSKDQTPSDKALLTSKKLYLKTIPFQNKLLDDTNLQIDNRNNGLRKIFNQRPSNEYISTNLTGYFPNTDMQKLQSTLKSSYRQSARMSMASNISIPHSMSSRQFNSNRVGDVLFKQSLAVDTALLGSLHPEADNNTTFNSSFTNDSLEADDEEVLPTTVSTPEAWLKGACIGSGSFGSVYLGMNAKTGELMAVKQVEIPYDNTSTSNNNSATGGDGSDNNKNENNNNNASHFYQKMVDALQHEMNLLKDLHHEHIVTYYGSSQEGQNFNIFLEYVPGGSVASMLKSYGPFEEPLIVNFIRQVLIGVSYLHKKNIIHRDIKGANILIDIKGCVKITDFGISKKLSPLNSKKMKANSTYGDEEESDNNKNKRASLQGSVYWMAPEVVKQTATTEKVDIWSTGCVVIEMFTGKHPFPDLSQMQAIFKVGTHVSPEIPSWATDVSRNFLSQAFEIDYKKRPSAIDLLQHPWLATQI